MRAIVAKRLRSMASRYATVGTRQLVGKHSGKPHETAFFNRPEQAINKIGTERWHCLQLKKAYKESKHG